MNKVLTTTKATPHSFDVEPLSGTPSDRSPAGADFSDSDRLVRFFSACSGDLLAHHRSKGVLENLVDGWNGMVTALIDPTSELWTQETFDDAAAEYGIAAEAFAFALRHTLTGLRLDSSTGLRPADDRAPLMAPNAKAAAVILAGNVPVLLPQVLLPALLTGTSLLVKLPTAIEHFPQAILRALRGHLPSAAGTILAVRWNAERSQGRAEAALRRARPRFDPTLVYGGGESIATFAADDGAAASTSDDTTIGFGPKTSWALWNDGERVDDWAERLALDIALFEQQGCLSVTTVIAVCPEARLPSIAAELAEALARLTHALPLPPRSARADQIQAAARRWLDTEILAGHSASGEIQTGGAVIAKWCSESPGRLDASDLPAQPLGSRCVRLVGVADLKSAVGRIAGSAKHLQGIAVGGEVARSAVENTTSGITTGLRLTELGELQRTGMDWNNGGVDLVTLFAAHRQAPRR